jgi:hypothetical protein
MNPSTARALDRLLRKMARPPRPRRRFSTAPIVLALALALMHPLLTRLVPAVWGSMLPGGLEQARHLQGGPGLVWRMALALQNGGVRGVALLAGIAAAGLVLAFTARPLRWLVWPAAAGTILIDAAIVFITLRAALEATARSAGLP